MDIIRKIGMILLGQQDDVDFDDDIDDDLDVADDNDDDEDDDDAYNSTPSGNNSNPSFQRHGCWEDCGNKTHDTLVAVRIVKTGS